MADGLHLEAPLQSDNDPLPEQMRSFKKEVEIGRPNQDVFAEFRGEE